ncbi:MAG: NFACT family protein [Clostridiales bacterium]|jgi:predicted ribosome quality control (RQC) complex YloA/Tae2 family protein|nr:NFACT family protein [Clostridiales bacterium]
MALDGITLASTICELKRCLLGGRIDKVHQPEKDEIILNVRNKGCARKLLLTASASQPRLHLTERNKPNPMEAPMFCMILRKHIGGGKLIDIIQPGFERIAEFHIEAFNEMGDLTLKKLIIEIMGKHSNIILTDERGLILDSAKRVTHETSSVREVLPGKAYTRPPAQDKLDPLSAARGEFFDRLTGAAGRKLQQAIYQAFTGISPVTASEICARAGVDGDLPADLCAPEVLEAVYAKFSALMADVREERFDCGAYIARGPRGEGNGRPVEFACVDLTMMTAYKKQPFDSPSELLEFFYSERDSIYRMNQQTADLRKLVQMNIERCAKKQQVYLDTLRDIEGREALRLMGELITANIYSVKKGMTSFTARNYYEEGNPEVTIRLDPTLAASENAQAYFKKYNKQKRTYAALGEHMRQNQEELRYLEETLNAIATCAEAADIEEVRDELCEQGFLKKKKTAGAKLSARRLRTKKTQPLRFMSADGFEIFVGKNNRQNDELTLRFADSGDIWLHTKEIPGSHVIIRTGGKPVPDSTLAEAAKLAARFSKARDSSHVPVDYTARKNVKKPNGAKPGMVIYENYRTAYVTPD